jgi:hypothetical protein
MRLLDDLKARFPRLFSAASLAIALGVVGGIAAYERHANAGDSCCYPGAACCHPGAACCAGHRQAAK